MWTRSGVGVVLLGLLLVTSLTLRAQTALAVPPPAPVQPLPYSHRQHLALPDVECKRCHVNPGAGKLMTYPATSTCMSCHDKIPADRPSLQKLATFATSDKPIPWVRVYQLPEDVYWKHASHLAAEVKCTECHGPVPERDVIQQETNIVTMKGCMSCHEKRQVYTDCGDCHEPRQ
ncbi:MAG: cytochrome c3 family protein [Vicinamibacterales bacterium]